MKFCTHFRLVGIASLVVCVASACLSLPKSQQEVHAKYSHTELKPGKHYLAYHGELDMNLETAMEKWMSKAEKLCKSREFEREIQKQEMRGKEYSKDKYPFIEGKLICMTSAE